MSTNELSDKKIEAGWRDTFSTNNPFCPCDLKSFTKAVRWAERALAASGAKPAIQGEPAELAARIRAAIHGTETWRVMNAAEDGFCMEFSAPEYLSPQRACEKWLADQPPEWIERNGYHAVKSYTYTGAERLALEAADKLAASPQASPDGGAEAQQAAPQAEAKPAGQGTSYVGACPICHGNRAAYPAKVQQQQGEAQTWQFAAQGVLSDLDRLAKEGGSPLYGPSEIAAVIRYLATPLPAQVQPDPCMVCNALIVQRNATHYDEQDLAAAKVRGKIIADRLAAQVQPAEQVGEPVCEIMVGGLAPWGKAAVFKQWLAGKEGLPDGNHLLYLASPAPQQPVSAEATEPTEFHNPWRASLENCISGDNYLRASEYRDLIADLDRLYALEQGAALSPQQAEQGGKP